MLPHAKAQPRHDPAVPHTVRVLRSNEELAEAQARASVHARRLQDRLEARAVRDAWTAAYQADEPSMFCLTSPNTRAEVPGPLAGIGSTHAPLDGFVRRTVA